MDRFNPPIIHPAGAWSPTIVGGATAGDYAIDVDPANRYVRVGQIVHLWGRLTITVNSVGTGFIRLGGLPLPSLPDSVFNAVLEVSNVTLPDNTVYLTTTREAVASADFFNIAAILDGATKERLHVSSLATGSEIRLYLAYLTSG